MTTKTVKVEITGDPSSFQRSMTVVSESAGKASTEATGHFDKATSKIGGLFKSLDSQLAGFGIPFTGALSTIGTKLEETSAKGASFGEKMATIAPSLGAGLAVAAGAIAVESIHLADAFENAQSRLKNALKNTGNNWDTYKGQIDATNLKLEGFGYTNTETEGALAKLVRATGDVGKSTKDMGLAADIAAGQHMSLEAATGLLVKVEGGRYTSLSRTLGLSKETIASFQNTGQAVDFLSGKYKGSAAAAAETFQGKIKVLTAQLEDIGIKIGTVLIPIIEALVSAIADVIGWFERHKAVAEALGTVIKVFLIVTIGALVAAVIWLSNNWRSAWDAIQSALGAAWGFISGVFETIKSALVGGVGGALAFLRAVWAAIWNDIRGVAEAVAGGIVGALSPIINTLRTIINAAHEVANAISSIPNPPSGGGIAGKLGLGLSFVGLSDGGFVPGSGNTDSVPTMLTPGEFVVSKDMMRSGSVPALTGASGGSGGGGPSTIVIRMVVDGKVLHESLLKRNRQNGSLRFT